MSKTITIIQLLNKIANEEEVPKKIIFQDREYKYIRDDDNDFIYIDEDHIKIHLFNDLDYITNMLNDEVEIIEEQEEINIQAIKENNSTNARADVNQENINILIKAVKYLDNKLKEK